MKIHYSYIAILFLLVSLTSCTTALHPIDEKPLVKIDSCLLGKWKTKDKPDIFTVVKKDDYQYFLIIKESKKKELQRVPMYLSLVNNTRFLNMMDIEADSVKGYNFLRLINISKGCDRITCAMVTDTMIEKMNSSSEIRSYITKNMNKPSFYKDTAVLYKVK